VELGTGAIERNRLGQPAAPKHPTGGKPWPQARLALALPRPARRLHEPPQLARARALV